MARWTKDDIFELLLVVGTVEARDIHRFLYTEKTKNSVYRKLKKLNVDPRKELTVEEINAILETEAG